MKKEKRGHRFDGLIALVLFGVFAVCVLAVLLTGADAYRRLTDRDQSAYALRTCAQYVATRVRQADSLDAVTVEDFGGTQALVFAEGDFVTRVYCYDGWLMELYSETGTELGPEAGEKIIEAGGLALHLEAGLLEAAVTGADGRQARLLLSLRSGEEGAA